MANFKQEYRQSVRKKLDVAIGTQPHNPTEEKMREATVAVLTGSTYAEAKRLYGASQETIKRFIEQAFPSDGDRFAFMEDCMHANGMLANTVFQQKFESMTAMEAAKASVMFAGRAMEIRKSREAGFKEAPINIGIIVQLEKTLNILSNGNQKSS